MGYGLSNCRDEYGKELLRVYLKYKCLCFINYFYLFRILKYIKLKSYYSVILQKLEKCITFNLGLDFHFISTGFSKSFSLLFSL